VRLPLLPPAFDQNKRTPAIASLVTSDFSALISITLREHQKVIFKRIYVVVKE
jgi:hypothetical protein